MNRKIRRTIGAAVMLAVLTIGAGCTNASQNPMAPDRGELAPGAASLSKGGALPGLPGDVGGIDIQPLGYGLAWP